MMYTVTAWRSFSENWSFELVMPRKPSGPVEYH